MNTERIAESQRQTSQEVRARLAEANPDAILLDGLDDALVGIGGQYTVDPLAVYSANKIIATLRAQGMSDEDAIEWFEYNIACLWAGKHTPIIIDDLE